MANNEVTVYDAFVRILEREPEDETLRDLATDSNCGRDCLRVIHAAAVLLAVSDRGVHDRIIEVAEEAIGIYWRG